MSDYPSPFIPHAIELDGHRLSYIDEGKGRTIVMLHGNPTWSFMYRRMIARLAPGYRVIAPDHMGCGLSDKPQAYPYVLETHIQNLERLLATLNIQKLTLMVHDWGGAIGMGYATRHPEQIESLIIFNTAAFRSRRMPWRIRLCGLPLLGPLLVQGLNGFARAALSMAVTRPLSPEIKRGLLAPYDSWQNRVAILQFVRDIPMSSRHPSWQTLVDIEAGLAELRDKPVLLVWGGKDFCFNRGFYDRWLEIFPNAKATYLDEVGHYLLEDAFEQVTPLVEQFLQDHPDNP